jgi:hypothetical protein
MAALPTGTANGLGGADALSRLPRITWRGITFPFDDLKTEFRHDIAEHMAPDVDGANVEGTGRRARVVSCKAIFLNRGAVFETTGYLDSFGNVLPLFPDVFRLFVAAMEDRSVGDFYHPVRGAMRCRPVSGGDTISSKQRDGVVLECQWIETNEEDTIPAAPQLGDLSMLTREARSLDAMLAALSPQPKAAAMPSMSFASLVAQTTGAFDSVTLAKNQATGKLDNIIAQVTRLQTSMVGAQDAAWLATMGPLMSTCERIKSALYARKATATAGQRAVSNYVVPMDQTLGAIANHLGAKVDDLLKLNPSAASAPVVKRSTLIRYYA